MPKNYISPLTDEDLYEVIEGAFEKILQTTVQPLSLVPESDWNKWDDFVIQNRLTEKLQKILTNSFLYGSSTFTILKNEAEGGVDVVVPVSTGQLFTNRGGTTVVKSAQVIAEQRNILYDAPAGTKMFAYIKKNGAVLSSQNVITAKKGGGYDYSAALAETGFVPTNLKTIPIVWFTNEWLTQRQRAIISGYKKTAFNILKELMAQIELAGPNIMLITPSGTKIGQAGQLKNALQKRGNRVSIITENLSRQQTNPVMSFNNQPWFKEFWEQIEGMVNTLIEGLQVGDMNGGGKGTANMHTTEVATSFGVKAQKIINFQNMFLSSWALFAKILRENGVSIPVKTKFTYDSPDNLLVNQMKDTTSDNIDSEGQIESNDSENKGDQ